MVLVSDVRPPEDHAGAYTLRAVTNPARRFEHYRCPQHH